MDFDEILAASAATEGFKSDLRRFQLDGHAPRISSARPAPHVKLWRVLMQLLAHHPELSIERVRVDARSGCSHYTGQAEVDCTDGRRRFDFAWDCAWRAEREGWRDCFGFPDQIRAAREFGWRCFSRWATADPDAIDERHLALR